MMFEEPFFQAAWVKDMWQSFLGESNLAETELVDFNNPIVAVKINNLRTEDDEETAMNMFNYVKKNIVYDKTLLASEVTSPRGKTASEIIERGMGVCADTTILLTALLRGAGIPARAQEGYYNEEITHAWVEAYYNGKWNLMDVLNTRTNKEKETHLYRGLLDVDLNTNDIFYIDKFEQLQLLMQGSIEYNLKQGWGTLRTLGKMFWHM
jgi:transglutaminase-like putative cysteine protease